MVNIKWDIKRGADVYRQVFDSRLKSWISTGKIKRGEAVVMRSGFSGWRKPERLKELTPYFRRYERAQSRNIKRREPARSALSGRIDLPNSTRGGVLPEKNQIKSILIIDDEKDLCMLLGDALRTHGYNVKAVHTRKEAMSSLKTQIPDLVYCDLKLSNGDGMKILSEIRSISPGTIVSMITAYGSEEARAEAKRLGAYSFIDKPFSEEDILENIKELKEGPGRGVK